MCQAKNNAVENGKTERIAMQNIMQLRAVEIPYKLQPRLAAHDQPNSNFVNDFWFIIHVRANEIKFTKAGGMKEIKIHQLDV